MPNAETTGAALLGRVSSEGAVVVPLAQAWATTPELLRDAAAASPFTFVARLLGVEPLLVERQPTRPVPEGRSFASTRVDTPLHTDSQMFLRAPAAIQVLVCVKAAPRGGESVLVDGARVVARLEREDPALAAALFATDRPATALLLRRRRRPDPRAARRAPRVDIRPERRSCGGRIAGGGG